MKDIKVSFLLVLIMLLSIPAGCLAEASGTEYYLPEVGITLRLPDDYYVLTRDISASDPALSIIGFTQSECLSFMEERHIYLNAFTKDSGREIVVTMSDSVLKDLSKVPDKTLNSFQSSLEDMYSSAGVSVDSVEIYRHNQAKFVVLNINQPSEAGTTYGVEYSTVYDSKAINITFHSYGSEWTNEEMLWLQSIVDNVVFDAASSAGEKTVEETNPIHYKSLETGIEFTVPANWHQAEFSKEREMLKAKFVSNDGGAMILYGNMDAWSEMTAVERASVGFSRSQLDFSCFTDADLEMLAEAYGSVEGTYSKETINGIEYCRLDSGVTSNMLDMPVIIYLTVDNGYMQYFQYNSYNTEGHEEEFLNLMNSVQYPSSSKALVAVQPSSSSSSAPVDSTKPTEVSSSAVSAGHGNSMILLLAGMALGILAVVFLVKAVKKKKYGEYYDEVHQHKKGSGSERNVMKSDHQPFDSKIVAERQEEQVVLPIVPKICASCSEKIPEGSKFCPYCGSKL